MAKINDLPIELLEHIFDDAATTFSPRWHLNLPTPSRTLFPFNVGSTCALWLSVLKSKAKYWRQVVIDVADDPAPFLDMLTSFNVDGLNTVRNIIVFSSMKDSVSLPCGGHDDGAHKEAKAIENARARAVFERLEESIMDCGSITFDLVYQSSLPSSARIFSSGLPHMHQLTLNCSIHDCDEIAVDHAGPLTVYPLDSLDQTSISLTGASFMELCSYSPDQISPFTDLFGLELSINHFVFDSVQQVRSFQRALADILAYSTLSLSDLTLTCSASPKPRLDVLIDVGHLVFDSVSSELLEEFTPAIFHNQTVQILSFRRCYLPYNHFHACREAALCESLQLIQLIDILHTDDEDMISNILYNLTPRHVRLLRCDILADKLFSNLADSECSRIQTVELHSCSGFSSSGVRAFVQARRDLHLSDPEQNDAFEALEVCGTGPLLSADDAAFFRVEHPDEDLNEFSVTRVEWNVVGHDSIPDGYMTDLRPAWEVRPILLGESLWPECPLAQVSKDALYTIDADAYSTCM